MTAPVPELGEALAALAEALEAGEVERAAEASARVAKAQEAAVASGLRLAPDAVASAQELLARCARAAHPIENRLAASLLLSGKSTRALRAYRGR